MSDIQQFLNIINNPIPYHQRNLLLSNALLLDLPTHYVIGVPAPGPDKVLLPIIAFYKLNVSNGVYGNIGNDEYLSISYGDSSTSPFIRLPLNDTFDGFSDSINAGIFSPGFSLSESNIQSVTPFAFTELANQPFIIRAPNSNGPGNFNGGNPLNYMYLNITYLVLNLVTNQFE